MKKRTLFLALSFFVLLALPCAAVSAAEGDAGSFAVPAIRGETLKEILASLSEEAVVRAAAEAPQEIPSFQIDRDAALLVFSVPYSRLDPAGIETAEDLLAVCPAAASAEIPLVSRSGGETRVIGSVTLTPGADGICRQTVVWYGAASRTPWEALARAVREKTVGEPTAAALLASERPNGETVLLVRTASGDGILSFLYEGEEGERFSSLRDYLPARIAQEEKTAHGGILAFLGAILPGLSLLSVAVLLTAAGIAVLAVVILLAVRRSRRKAAL
ncbi:MAG: hypothetical protein IJR89_02875 [Clostridia bacterium]|nr:hypothetical protein [Clostridia bacterium]